jgi:hypothetical protein
MHSFMGYRIYPYPQSPKSRHHMPHGTHLCTSIDWLHRKGDASQQMISNCVSGVWENAPRHGTRHIQRFCRAPGSCNLTILFHGADGLLDSRRSVAPRGYAHGQGICMLPVMSAAGSWLVQAYGKDAVCRERALGLQPVFDLTSQSLCSPFFSIGNSFQRALARERRTSVLHWKPASLTHAIF